MVRKTGDWHEYHIEMLSGFETALLRICRSYELPEELRMLHIS